MTSINVHVMCNGLTAYTNASTGVSCRRPQTIEIHALTLVAGVQGVAARRATMSGSGELERSFLVD